MSDIAALVADNLNIWTSAIERKSSAGRGASKKINLYGIERLRALILDLAVRGKLVEQDARDESASELLCKITAENEKLLQLGVLKKAKLPPKIEENEIPTDLPSNWKWVRLGEICGLENGDRGKNYPNKSVLVESGVPFVNAGHLQKGEVDVDEMTYISRERFDLLNSGKFREGDILFCLRGSLGKSAVVRGLDEGAIASSLVIIRFGSSISQGYISAYFDSGFALNMVRRFDNGTAQPNLSSTDLAKFLVPLPPLAEQKRIVAKVDELMALCDALERESEDALAAHQALVENLLATLTTSTDAADLATNWARLEAHFDTLFTTDASIDALKQTILDLAVRGKLVEQDAEEESGSELVERLQRHFEQSNTKSSKGRSSKKVISPKPIGFSMPDGWREATFSDVGETFIGLTYSPKNVGSVGTPVLRSSNVQQGKIDLSDLVRVKSEVREKLYLEIGDLLICVRNGSRSLVGKCALIESLAEPTTFGAFMAVFKSPLNAYIKIFVESPTFRRLLLGVETTTINQITQANLKSSAIAIPPLAEQERIVAKVDELMELCEQLKSRLADAAETQRHLAVAVSQQAAA